MLRDELQVDEGVGLLISQTRCSLSYQRLIFIGPFASLWSMPCFLTFELFMLAIYFRPSKAALLLQPLLASPSCKLCLPRSASVNCVRILIPQVFLAQARNCAVWC